MLYHPRLVRGGNVRTSDSFWKAYRLCRRKSFYQFVLGIEPRMDITHPLRFGKIQSECMEALDKNEDWLPVIYSHLSEKHLREHSIAIILDEMMKGYVKRWGLPSDCSPEIKFEGEVKHPHTGVVLPKIIYAGRVDSVLRKKEPFTWGEEELPPGLYVRETKTASQPNESYLAKLWADSQVLTYTEYVRGLMQEDVEAVLYDVIKKPDLKNVMVKGETEYEFSMRVQRETDRAKDGKLGRRIRQRKDETDEEFAQRRIERGLEEVSELSRHYDTDPNEYRAGLTEFFEKKEAYQRAVVRAGGRVMESILEDLFTDAKEVLERVASTIDAVEGDAVTLLGAAYLWPRAWGQACHSFSRRCEFWSLCTTGDDQNILDDQFSQSERDSEEETIHVSAEMLRSAARFPGAYEVRIGGELMTLTSDSAPVEEIAEAFRNFKPAEPEYADEHEAF